MMKLKYPWFDGRTVVGRLPQDIVDETTKNNVGFVQQTGDGKDVLLFASKYSGNFKNDDQCYGFMKGVEAVLNHLTSTNFETTPLLQYNDRYRRPDDPS